MSAILTGLLQPRLEKAIKDFKWNSLNSLQTETAQDAYIRDLSVAISVSVQEYLDKYVLVLVGQTVITAGGPTNQVGTTTTPGDLLVP
jgi:hypothetical protein